MLDVMKNPPPVTVSATWTACRVEHPNDARTVQTYCPDDTEDPVWLGYWDAQADSWYSVEGFPLAMVTWWAEKTPAPAEPKPGQAMPQAADTVAATMEHAVALVYGSDGMPSQVKKHHLQWIVRTLLKQLGLGALAGLLHDAAEAFIGDVAKPLKQLLPDYKLIEDRVEAAVLARFGLPPKLPQTVKDADMVMLATEKRDLMPGDPHTWECIAGHRPLPDRIEPWSAVLARRAFLGRYSALTGAARFA